MRGLGEAESQLKEAEKLSSEKVKVAEDLRARIDRT